MSWPGLGESLPLMAAARVCIITAFTPGVAAFEVFRRGRL